MTDISTLSIILGSSAVQIFVLAVIGFMKSPEKSASEEIKSLLDFACLSGVAMALFALAVHFA